MKKYLYLIISILYFITFFILNWYSDNIFRVSFILLSIISFVIYILFPCLLLYLIIKIIEKKSYIDIISVIILNITGIFNMNFPYREIKTKVEFNKYEIQRLEIIEMIKDEKLIPDEFNNVVLPDDYKNCSVDGEAYIYQNNIEGIEISFWMFRGMQSGSVELIYSTGEELIRKNESGPQIRKIEKIQDNWYLVTTDY